MLPGTRDNKLSYPELDLRKRLINDRYSTMLVIVKVTHIGLELIVIFSNTLYDFYFVFMSMVH